MAIRKVVPGSLTDAYKLRQADFAPNLVGNQFTSPNAFFTLGNFEITSNFSGRVSKDFTLGEFSDYYNLDNLNITEQQLEEQISNNVFVNLNFDKTNVFKYVNDNPIFSLFNTSIIMLTLNKPRFDVSLSANDDAI